MNLFQSPYDRPQQKAEQESQDDGQEKRPSGIERVEGGEDEQAGQGDRPDAEGPLQKIPEPVDVGTGEVLRGSLLADRVEHAEDSTAVAAGTYRREERRA